MSVPHERENPHHQHPENIAYTHPRPSWRKAPVGNLLHWLANRETASIRKRGKVYGETPLAELHQSHHRQNRLSELPPLEDSEPLSTAATRAAELYRTEQFGTDPETGPFSTLAAEFPAYAGGIRLIADIGYDGPLARSFSGHSGEQVTSAFSSIKDEGARYFLEHSVFYRWDRQPEGSPQKTVEEITVEIAAEVDLVHVAFQTAAEDVTLEHVFSALLIWQRDMATPEE